MLNIKFAELTENSVNALPFSITLSLAFIFEFFSLQLANNSLELFIIDFTKSFSINHSFAEFCQLFSNVQVVSFALFNDFLYCFFLSSLVLLLAMVGTITLTLKKH